MKRCCSKNIDAAGWPELPFIQIDFLLKGNTAHCTHQDAGPRRDNAMHSSAMWSSIYSAESPGIETHTFLPSSTHNVFLLPPHTSTSSTWPPPPAYTPTLALTGSDLATLGRRRLPGSKLRQALYGGSPTVAQCLPPPANLQIA